MTNTNEKAIEVERAAWLLLGTLEDPGASPEDETRAALDLRRALGERPDPLAALDAAERALLIAGGWRESNDPDDPDSWICTDGVWISRTGALKIARGRLAAKGGAS